MIKLKNSAQKFYFYKTKFKFQKSVKLNQHLVDAFATFSLIKFTGEKLNYTKYWIKTLFSFDQVFFSLCTISILLKSFRSTSFVYCILQVPPYLSNSSMNISASNGICASYFVDDKKTLCLR